MLSIHELRAEQLIKLARERFDRHLTDVERRVLSHSCGYEDPTEAENSSAAGFSGVTKRRPQRGWQGPTIRPSLIRWVLTDHDALCLLEHRGLRIWHARVVTPLDLGGVHSRAPLEFRYCLMEAPVQLSSAVLPGLYLLHTTFEKELDARHITIEGPLVWDDIMANEVIRLDGSTVGADLRFSNMDLTSTGVALSMRGSTITTDVTLAPNLHSSGGLLLNDIQVGGFLDIRGAQLSGTLDLDNAKVRGDVHLQEAFFRDNVRMADALIGGLLNCDRASFLGRYAFFLPGASVRGDVLIQEVSAKGEISVQGGRVGGSLRCGGASIQSRHALLLNGEAERGLTLDNITVEGDVLLDRNFDSLGEVRMQNAQVGGNVVCQDARIRSFYGEKMQLGQDFRWLGIADAGKSSLILTSSKMRALYDERQSWPSNGALFITGLKVDYLHLKGSSTGLDVDARIAWLNLQHDKATPEPWMRLAEMLMIQGESGRAKRVIFNQKINRARQKGHFWIGWLLAWREREPMLVLASIALFTILGTALFWPLEAHFAPTNETAYKASVQAEGHQVGGPLAYPKFQPLVYSLENVLPVVKLGQDEHWAPDPHHSSAVTYWSLMSMRWFLILVGWAQGLILAAAVGARFRA